MVCHRTRRNDRRVTWGAWVAVAVMLGAACGSDDVASPAAPSDTESPADTPPDTESPADEPSDTESPADETSDTESPADEPPDAEAPGESAPNPPEETSTDPPDSPPATEDGGALKRKDVPPDGVDDQFDTFGTPNLIRPCQLTISPSEVDEGTVEVGQVVTICADVAFASSDVEVNISANGTVIGRGTIRVAGGGLIPAFIPILPGTPQDTYDVVADQTATGGPAASGLLKITAATELRAVAGPASGPPGTTFAIGYAGLAPNEVFSVSLYGSDGAAPGDLSGVHWVYLTAVDFASDEAGEALVELESDTDDLARQYRLEAPGLPLLTFTIT